MARRYCESASLAGDSRVRRLPGQSASIAGFGGRPVRPGGATDPPGCLPNRSIRLYVAALRPVLRAFTDHGASSAHARLSSVGRIAWRARIRRSRVQRATRRAELWATSKRSKGSRVQSSLRVWRTIVTSGMSSTVNLASSITVVMNSGLRTESRPISARNWISRKETGDTPQGRYRSIQGNSASRFDRRTSQIRKWVSRSSVTARERVATRGRAPRLATPRTTDRPCRRPVRVGGDGRRDAPSHSPRRPTPRGGGRCDVPSAGPR